MPDEQGFTVGQLLLAEDQTIKDSHRARIGFRDSLLYVTLGAVAVVAAAAQAELASTLPALPPACVVLGRTYLANDEMTGQRRHRVREELGPRLARPASAEGDFTAFGGEAHHRTDVRRRTRKTIQAVIDLTAFRAVPLAAPAVFWAAAPAGPGSLTAPAPTGRPAPAAPPARTGDSAPPAPPPPGAPGTAGP
ncbi:hypothetical protein AB0D38_02350 [Streptomyces sp. NPDC048279]|uniref:hypothetical protein n=1 Tax=Streptomyces sp. NPDC048279 TaxID=3154714 RepID=UPI00341288AF